MILCLRPITSTWLYASTRNQTDLTSTIVNSAALHTITVPTNLGIQVIVQMNREMQEGSDYILLTSLLSPINFIYTSISSVVRSTHRPLSARDLQAWAPSIQLAFEPVLVS